MSFHNIGNDATIKKKSYKKKKQIQFRTIYIYIVVFAIFLTDLQENWADFVSSRFY